MNALARRRQVALVIRLFDELAGGDVLILNQGAADKWNDATRRLRSLHADLCNEMDCLRARAGESEQREGGEDG